MGFGSVQTGEYDRVRRTSRGHVPEDRDIKFLSLALRTILARFSGLALDDASSWQESAAGAIDVNNGVSSLPLCLNSGLS